MPHNFQESFHDDGHDYWQASPHLKHRHLYTRLTDLICDAVDDAISRDLSPTVLEIGAGDGSITERLLAAGYSVTATEMSEPAVDRTRARFPHNKQLRVLYDDDGSLDRLAGSNYSAIIFASVLHHIPDYMASVSHAIKQLLIPHGAFVSIQDPLWYPRRPATVRKASEGAYLTWRISQGNLQKGLSTRFRRATRGVTETALSDVVEYHVVRNGVDEHALCDLLAQHFSGVSMLTYWSTQGRVQQWLGDRCRLRNTFALSAVDYTPDH